jgi:hypothetical protein
VNKAKNDHLDIDLNRNAAILKCVGRVSTKRFANYAMPVFLPEAAVLPDIAVLQSLTRRRISRNAEWRNH